MYKNYYFNKKVFLLCFGLIIFSSFIFNESDEPNWRKGKIITKKDTLLGLIDIYENEGHVYSQIKRGERKPKKFSAKKMKAIILDDGTTYRKFKSWGNEMLKKEADGYLEFYERTYKILKYSHSTFEGFVKTSYSKYQDIHHWGVYHTKKDETIQLAGSNWENRLATLIEDNEVLHRELITKSNPESNSLSDFETVKYFVKKYNKSKK